MQNRMLSLLRFSSFIGWNHYILSSFCQDTYKLHLFSGTLKPMSESNVSQRTIPTMTVHQISRAIQSVVQNNFSNIRLKGEISGFKRHTSGHLYMSLKDETAALDAVCWRGVAGSLKHQPEEGLEVICQGRITTYPARSKYQFVIERLEPAGVGALLKVLQERKERLEKEGLFEESSKQPLPYLPKKIGIITSETGAVIQDILHRIEDRFPSHIFLWPVHVQGDKAAAEIISALQEVACLPDSCRPDVLIIARGGGSVEDLWAFNDEGLVRAVAACSIPVISAVGHETDITLSDYVADKRAPTPTAAAEMAVPVRCDLWDRVIHLEERSFHSMQRLVQEKARFLEAHTRPIISSKRFLDEHMYKVDDMDTRLTRCLTSLIRGKKLHLLVMMKRFSSVDISRFIPLYHKDVTQLMKRLNVSVRYSMTTCQTHLATKNAILCNISHYAILEKGYAMVCDAQGSIMQNVKQLRPEMDVSIVLKDGKKPAKIL